MNWAWVSFLFFFSGFSGLLYEVLWAKYLSLTLGNTALANTIVLAAFLGGLALGNAALGPLADRVKSPLRLYAVLELAIAGFGLMSPSLLEALYAVAPVWPLWARLLASAALVAFPGALMGGTLPALAAQTAAPAQVEASVSWLYFLNSAGAALGALAAGFFFIAAWGIVRSVYAATAMSAAIGFSGFLLSLRVKKTAQTINAQQKIRVDLPQGALRAYLVYAVVFVSGLAALIYETAWIRLLASTFGSSTYSFSVMLAAFITGLALGSFWIARSAFRFLNAYLLLGLAELALALSLSVTLPLYDKLPFCFLWLNSALPRLPLYYPLYEAAKFLFALCLMLPPTVCLGMTLPLASQAASPAAGRVGREVSAVFGLNALGNVLGATVGLYLLPRVGIEGLFVTGIWFNLAAGALVLATDRQRGVGRKTLITLACVLAGAWTALRPPWNKMFVSLGTFRLAGLANLDYRTYRNVFKDYRLLYYKDDSNVTVSVMQYKDQQLSLLLNGKADASSGKDMRTQALLGHLPLVLNPRASEVLVVGLGSGVTAGAALRHPIAGLDVVEISSGVVEASRYFDPYNGRPLQDPRCRLYVEDAKTFLRQKGRSYDVIISEPSNPWMAGMGGLFSTDFYREVCAHLKPGGMMVQWLHLYEMDDDTLRLILRTFDSVFEEVTVWHTYGNDILLLGTLEPLQPDFSALETEFARSPVRQDLAKNGLHSVGALLALQTASDSSARKMALSGPLNEDRFPRLEYQAPRALFFRSMSELVDQQDDNLKGRAGSLYLRRYLAWRRRPLSKEELKNIVEFQSGYRSSFLQAILNEWGRLYPRDPEYRMVRIRSELEALDYEAAYADLQELLRREPDKALYLEMCADVEWKLYRTNGKPALARQALERLKRAASRPGADKAVMHHKMARIYKERGDTRAALLYLDKAALEARWGSALKPDALWIEAAELAWDMEDKGALMDNLEKAMNYNPDNEKVRDMLAILTEAVNRRSR